MFEERYRITRDTMEEIMRKYIHPSRDDAVAREKMMREIRSHMRTRYEEDSKIESYDSLELSFM